ncbi:MAG: hypothetical protein AB7H80_10115, partial [Candidatus Kapaibacterium sp.]
GGGYYKLGLNLTRSDKFYEGDGNVITIPTFSDYTVSLYGEYGITKEITGILYLPFVKRLTLNRQVGQPSGFVYSEGDGVTGIADPEVGLRVGLLRSGPAVITAGLKLGIPLGESEQESGLLTGDGEFNQILSAGLGYSFYPLPAYASLHGGLNNRTEGFSDEIIYGGEFGYTFGGKVTAIGRFVGVGSLINGDANVRGGMGGASANNQSYLSYGLEGAWRLSNNLGISLGVTSAFFGQNTLSAPSFSTGIYLKR